MTTIEYRLNIYEPDGCYRGTYGMLQCQTYQRADNSYSTYYAYTTPLFSVAITREQFTWMLQRARKSLKPNERIVTTRRQS